MANAILFDILTGLKSAIVNRGLAGISSTNIIIQKRPTTRASDLPAQPWPAIIIAPWGAEDLDPEKGSDIRDDLAYPVIVAVVGADAQDQTVHFNQYLTWRESIRKKFHNQHLYAQDGTTELAYKVLVRPLDIVDREAWDKLGLYISGMVLNCWSREARG